MATDKKFAVAGVSTLDGKTKIRFANDVMRIKILAKNGHKAYVEKKNPAPKAAKTPAVKAEAVTA